MADFGRIASEVNEVAGQFSPNGYVASELSEVAGLFDPHGRVSGMLGEEVGYLTTTEGRVSLVLLEVLWQPPAGAGMILLGDHADQHSGVMLGHAATVRAGRGNWRRTR